MHKSNAYKASDAAIHAVRTPAGDGRLVTYLRLLDAQWDRADWQELAIDPAILHIDLVREPIRSHRAWAPGTRPLATENGYRISCATAPTLRFGLLPNWQRPSRGGSRQTPFFCPVPATAATEIVPLPFTEAQAQHPPEIDQPRLDFAVSPGKMAANCGDGWAGG